MIEAPSPDEDSSEGYEDTGATCLRPRICVVTATRDRLTLLQRLHLSLTTQTDQDFIWLVVDDASSDGTIEWLEQTVDRSRFEVLAIRRDDNVGKTACLNVAFDLALADFYLVVDSDDLLLESAIEMVRLQVSQDLQKQDIGAIFFSYRDADTGKPLGGPPNGREISATRSTFDCSYGKYDGCVGYFDRVVRSVKYPVVPGETYVGETVLQLLMEPSFRINFVPTVVGIAEYQNTGLTAAGRRLRIKNPAGMMIYSALKASLSPRSGQRVRHAIGFWAYASILNKPRREWPNTPTSWPSRFWRPFGSLLARYWERRARASQ